MSSFGGFWGGGGRGGLPHRSQTICIFQQSESELFTGDTSEWWWWGGKFCKMRAHSIYPIFQGGCLGALPPEDFWISRLREKPSNTFLPDIFFFGLFFIFLFHINQFSLLFFCYSLKFSDYSLFLSPHFSLISIKNGHYSLINKPHTGPPISVKSQFDNYLLLLQLKE